MGWGLKVKEDVTAGTLVIEYVGEIITEKQMIVSSSVLLQHTLDIFMLTNLPP